MIYTLGYQRLTVDAVDTLLTRLGAILVDVRSVPSSRKAGFSRAALATRFGDRYAYRGDVLGGRGDGPTAEGLRWLEGVDRPVILMCLEHAPGDCHRHHTIAMRLRREVTHLMPLEDEAFSAVELARAIANDDDYSCVSLESL